MSFQPAKRQRSNTSRESTNAIPPTTAPALRQHQHQAQHQHQHASHLNGSPLSGSPLNGSHLNGSHLNGSHLNGNLALYPSAAAASAGYGTASYAATTPSAAASAHQALAYASYPAGPVTTQHNGYGSGGYSTSASTGYGTTPYSPQHQTNPYGQYSHAQASPQLSPHAGHFSSGLNGVQNVQSVQSVQNAGYPPTHSHNPQATTRITYSPVSAANPAAASYNQPPPQRSTASVAALQNQSHHSSLSSYSDSYGTHTPTTHSGPYHSASPSYQDPSVASHYSPAPMPTPQSHDVSRQMSEDLTENEEEDAQGEPADESAELFTNPDQIRPPVSSIPTPTTDQSKPGEMSCSCKKGRGKKKVCVSCGCSKYGLSCNQACSCGGICGNPFTDLTAFFGPSDSFPRPCSANPCFATWLRNQPNVEELDADLMVDMLLSDDKSWTDIREYTDAFRRWEDQWKKARGAKSKKGKEERERLEFELLRGGLGNTQPEDFHGFRYSFCQSQWISADLWEHCPECRMCRPNGEWHCHKHDRCTENRVCPNCSTTTLPYHHQHPQDRQAMYVGQGS
ncbi:hypothetical protein F4777DRAFT_574547 [Nemania sp. FL0916]|nr:hypothetical protein F4777DRAFT_574547 [Nemania sp. FL0916]